MTSYCKNMRLFYCLKKWINEEENDWGSKRESVRSAYITYMFYFRRFKMKYKVLLKRLQDLDEEQLDMDVTVRTKDDEFFAISRMSITTETDVLDKNHPFLLVK